MITFKTNQEILDAISPEGLIKGLVEIDFYLPGENIIMDDCNDFFTNRLVGEQYGYLLEDIRYRIAGANVLKQTILVEVIADAKSLLFDLVTSF